MKSDKQSSRKERAKTAGQVLQYITVKAEYRQSGVVAQAIEFTIRWVICLSVFLFNGCWQKPVPIDPQTSPNPHVELSVGGSAEDDGGSLPFRITTVYEKQKASTTSPFHEDGGVWTYFDCQASADRNVLFTVGIMSKNSADGALVGWGRAALAVNDQEAGGRFVELFGKSFPGVMPAPVKRSPWVGSLFVHTAILGEDLKRESGGGFSGERGGWTATKWFPEYDGCSGEVFFNYNLEKRQGEFSEKDADYADDLLAVFSAVLRDGPRPERTPENDPNVTRIGPRIDSPRTLATRTISHYSFSPNSRFAVFQDGSTTRALALDGPESEPFEVARFDHVPWEIQVQNDDLDLLVQEGIPERAGRSSGDPMRIWWVNHEQKEKKLLRGPEKDLSLSEAAASPDRLFVALYQWRENSGKRGRSRVLLFLDRERGSMAECDSGGTNLSHVGWKYTEAGLRAVAISNRWRLDEKEVSESILVDPTTGTSERQENVDARLELDNPLSPDGRHRVRLDKDKLVLTDLADGKQRPFILHEDDRRFADEECLAWVSPRYLRFNGQRLALIDVNTMKMSFPVPAEVPKFDSHSYTFSPNFRWVMYQGEVADKNSLYLASVQLPNEP